MPLPHPAFSCWEDTQSREPYCRVYNRYIQWTTDVVSRHISLRIIYRSSLVELGRFVYTWNYQDTIPAKYCWELDVSAEFYCWLTEQTDDWLVWVAKATSEWFAHNETVRTRFLLKMKWPWCKCQMFCGNHCRLMSSWIFHEPLLVQHLTANFYWFSVKPTEWSLNMSPHISAA